MKNDQVSVLLYGYQINKPKSFNQDILKNITSNVKATSKMECFCVPSGMFDWFLVCH